MNGEHLSENRVKIILDVDGKGGVRLLQDTQTGVRAVGVEAKQATGHIRQMNTINRNAIVMFKQLSAALAAYKVVDWANQAIDAYEGWEVALTDMGRVTDQSFEQIQESMRGVDPVLGHSTELVQGYYNVISAGVQEPVRAQYFLVNASKAAKSAHVDQAKTVEGTTKMLTGFAGELENSAEALDLLFTIEREGQTTFAQLVPIIGDISAISREAKVSATEMGGALALLTQTSGSTSEAATKYKAILMGLYKPQEKMAKLISQIGYASGQAMVQELGLANTLQAVKEHAEQTNIPLGKLFESSEALVGIAALSANNFETFR